MLSEVKVFIALLPDDAALELLAPMPEAADPAKRLGVRLPAGDRGPAGVDGRRKPCCRSGRRRTIIVSISRRRPGAHLHGAVHQAGCPRF